MDGLLAVWVWMLIERNLRDHNVGLAACSLLSCDAGYAAGANEKSLE